MGINNSVAYLARRSGQSPNQLFVDYDAASHPGADGYEDDIGVALAGAEPEFPVGLGIGIVVDHHARVEMGGYLLPQRVVVEAGLEVARGDDDSFAGVDMPRHAYAYARDVFVADAVFPQQALYEADYGVRYAGAILLFVIVNFTDVEKRSIA